MERARDQERGFTLLEMLVSITIIALIALTLWSVFRISLNSWSRGTALIDTNQRQRTILDQVKKQMASIYPVLAPVDLQTGGATYPIFFGSADRIQFVSLSSLRFTENPGLTLVSYELTRDQRGNYGLVEKEQQYLGLDPTLESVFDREDNSAITIFEDLVSFNFEYLDPGTDEKPPEWVREWDPREMKSMPQALSMAMVARDPNGKMMSRHLVVPILNQPYDPRLGFMNQLGSRPPLGVMHEPSPVR